uniref:Secreted protein n=1 Tax=Cacopsylla melanoneura TaxID=428564 RepID=A0A8D8XF06_9HEMI
MSKWGILCKMYCLFLCCAVSQVSSVGITALLYSVSRNSGHHSVASPSCLHLCLFQTVLPFHLVYICAISKSHKLPLGCKYGNILYTRSYGKRQHHEWSLFLHAFS